MPSFEKWKQNQESSGKDEALPIGTFVYKRFSSTNFEKGFDYQVRN